MSVLEWLTLALPVLVAFTIVFRSYVDTSVDLQLAMRPLIAVPAITIAVQLVLTGLLRSASRAALLTTGLVLATFNLWVIPVIAAPLTAWELVRSRRLGRSSRLPSVADANRGATLIVVIALAFAVVNGLQRGGLGAPRASGAAKMEPAVGLPDIYIIVLDGHARADTLERLGVDTSAYLAKLEARGLSVAQESRSNYTQTALTMTSMLYMRHIDELVDEVPAEIREQFRMIGDLLDVETPAIRAFREGGYEAIVIPSEIAQFDPRVSDRFLDSGHLNNLEEHILQHSLLYRVLELVAPNFIADQYRDRARHAFATLGEIAANPASTFTLAHVMLPHAPFVFGSDGSYPPMMDCVPGCGIYATDPTDSPRHYVGQWQHTSTLVIETIDRIQAESDQPPVIIVMSDHGSRLWPEDDAEKLRNFFAAVTPGHPDLFPRDTSPINVMPRLLSAYLGSELALQPEQSYYSTIGAPWPNATFTGEP